MCRVRAVDQVEIIGRMIEEEVLASSTHHKIVHIRDLWPVRLNQKVGFSKRRIRIVVRFFLPLVIMNSAVIDKDHLYNSV